MQISRLLQMVYILQSRGRVSAAALAQELEVSVRTVYRDADALCQAGFPLYAERGRNGGLCLMPGCELSKSLLSDDERRSLLASLTAMAQAGADDGALLRKMTAFFGINAPDWVQIDFSDWSGQQSELLTRLKTAILCGNQLAFDYYGESGEATARRVCPLRLCFKARTWYLQAYCLERHALRTFKLTRIKRAQVLEAPFPPEALIAQPNDLPSDAAEPPPLTACLLRIDASMAFRVFDDFEEEAITQLDGGDFLVRSIFPAGPWNVSFILSYGPNAEVLAPASMRETIKKALQNMLERY